MCCSSDGGTARQQKQQRQRDRRKDHLETDIDDFGSEIDTAATTKATSETRLRSRVARDESNDRIIGLPVVAPRPFPVCPSPPALPSSQAIVWIVSIVLLLVSANGVGCSTSTAAAESAIANGSTAISTSTERRTLSNVDDVENSSDFTLTLPEAEAETTFGQPFSKIARSRDAVVEHERQRQTSDGDSVDLRQTTEALYSKHNSVTTTAAAAASNRKPTAIAKGEFAKYLLSNVIDSAIGSRQLAVSINISSTLIKVSADLTNTPPPPVDGDTEAIGQNDDSLATTVDFETRLPLSADVAGKEYEGPSKSHHKHAQSVPDEPVTDAGSKASNTSSTYDDTSHENQVTADESVAASLSTSGVEVSLQSSDDQTVRKDVSLSTSLHSATGRDWTTMSVPPSQNGFTEVASQSEETSRTNALRGTATDSVPSAQQLDTKTSPPSPSNVGGRDDVTVSGGTRRCLQTRDSRHRSTIAVDCVSDTDVRNATDREDLFDQPEVDDKKTGDDDDACRTFSELFCDRKLINRFLKGARQALTADSATLSEPQVNPRRQLRPSSRLWCENPNDVDRVQLLDQRAAHYYGLFEESMISYDCVDSYSITSNCSACEVSNVFENAKRFAGKGIQACSSVLRSALMSSV